jgi:hypothetical protein
MATLLLVAAASVVASALLLVASVRYYVHCLIVELRRSAALGRALNAYLAERFDDGSIPRA